MKKISSHNQGFTIVETLVATAILVVAVTGAMSAIQTGISSYTFSKDQVIATYLAQEAIEQLRNMRDENVLSGRDWLYGIASLSSDPCYFGQACYVDPIFSNTATRCPALGSCPTLNQDTASTRLYGYNSSWTPSPFRREIILSSINSDEITATVSIYWSKGSNQREFKIKESLFNW